MGVSTGPQQLRTGVGFSQNLEKVSLVTGLLQLMISVGFDRSLEKVGLIAGLQQLLIGVGIKRVWRMRASPRALSSSNRRWL